LQLSLVVLDSSHELMATCIGIYMWYLPALVFTWLCGGILVAKKQEVLTLFICEGILSVLELAVFWGLMWQHAEHTKYRFGLK
jgi:uncharacterized RDD family membrane protein YckC